MRVGRNIMQLKEKKIGFKEEFVGIQREVEKEGEENKRKINGNEEGNEHERKNEHVFHEIKNRQTHGHPDKEKHWRKEEKDRFHIYMRQYGQIFKSVLTKIGEC